MLKLDNIKIREEVLEEEVVKTACKKYNIDFKRVNNCHIFSKSIDARNKDDIHYNYSIIIECDNEYEEKNRKYKFEYKEIPLPEFRRKSNVTPVIIGAGPAGLFAALTLIEYGIKPVIIEQGKKVEDRIKDVDEYIKTGKLNVNSNVQFGEGGAGTFSDGKLTTGLHNPLCRKVLSEFVRFGAPNQILYINKPHIGTDNLVNIISNIRKYIESKGGVFLFEEKVTDINVEKNKVTSVMCSKKINTDTVILAPGHSARDTFEMLYKKGIKLERKNFSVGVRIEHLQEMINNSQYGKKCTLKLPPAEYKLVYHGKERSCYTFCMCPGGVVMPSSSEINTIVTNGMSKFARDGKNANSAVLVEVTPKDIKGKSPIEGIYFQKELEEKAFILGGEKYYAPIQRVKDFLENKKTEKIGKVDPSYKPGVTFSNLKEILPEFVSSSLSEALIYFDKKIKGFADPDAILTGVETRSSSPVKIVRNENLMASNIEGLYPCGEGAGYAGGIMSAAVDGIRCAHAIIQEER